MYDICPALARGTAQRDFTHGCDLHDNPYEAGTEAHQAWEDEMRILLRKEEIEDEELLGKYLH